MRPWANPGHSPRYDALLLGRAEAGLHTAASFRRLGMEKYLITPRPRARPRGGEPRRPSRPSALPAPGGVYPGFWPRHSGGSARTFPRRGWPRADRAACLRVQLTVPPIVVRLA